MDDELWENLLFLEELSLLSGTGVDLTMEEFHAIMEELRRLYDEAMEMTDYTCPSCGYVLPAWEAEKTLQAGGVPSCLVCQVNLVPKEEESEEAEDG